MSTGAEHPTLSVGAGSSSAALAAGFLIADRFKVLSVLGKGGMCTVLKAQDMQLDRTVAIKLLHDRFANDANALARFEREAQALSALKHPNIIESYSFGCLGSRVYIVTEFVDGISLAQLLQKQGPLSQGEALPIFFQICAALEHAHQNLIVHRDLKPANVMLVGAERTVKIVDFGIAKILEQGDAQKLTKTSSVIGTVLYASPEQCMGQDVDNRSDIYSFGCLMAEVLTGAPIFTAETPYAVMYKHLSQSLRPLHGVVDSVMTDAIKHCLAKDPGDRPQTVQQLRHELTAGPLRSRSMGLSISKPLGSHPVRWLSIAAVALCAWASAITW
jgi:serine/threonine-protein kinase